MFFKKYQYEKNVQELPSWNYNYSKIFKEKVLKTLNENVSNIIYLQDSTIKKRGIDDETYYKPLRFSRFKQKEYLHITCINKIKDYKNHSNNDYYYPLNEYLFYQSKNFISKEEKSLFNFCRKFNYNYLVTVNVHPPKIIKKYIVDSIGDINTNHKFYKLNFD